MKLDEEFSPIQSKRQELRVWLLRHPPRTGQKRLTLQALADALNIRLSSLCLGTPTLDNGFVDVDMKTIMSASGMSQRRCERAIADLKDAGLLTVNQPRKLNEHGDYVGLRAIRVVREIFFEFLQLGPMLRRERARATERLRRKAQRANRKLADMMRRISQGVKGFIRRPMVSRVEQERRDIDARRWNQACIKYMSGDFTADEIRRRVNAELGLPPDYSPGRA